MSPSAYYVIAALLGTLFGLMVGVRVGRLLGYLQATLLYRTLFFGADRTRPTEP